MIDVEALREFLLVFGLCITRMTAACTVTPFMASQLIQGRLRNSIVFSWGIIVYPIVAPTLDVTDLSTIAIIGIAVKEAMLGFLIGFMASRVFWIAMSVGFFIDNQRGASMASVFDPTAGEQTSPFGQFLQHTIIALLYSSGGFLVFLSALFESYLAWPIGSFTPQISDAFPGFFLEVLDDLVRTIVILAAPAIIAMLMATFGLGLMNRFAPQLNVFFLAMPVKSLIAMIVLIVYLPFLVVHFSEQVVGADTLFKFLGGAVP